MITTLIAIINNEHYGCQDISKFIDRLVARKIPMPHRVRRSQMVTFAAIRLRGPGFKPRPGQKFETGFLLHSHPSSGEDVSPMQGEAIRRHYIKPEYLYLSSGHQHYFSIPVL